MKPKFSLNHKFGAKATIIDEIKFSSKKEAEYYRKLKLAQQNGDLLFFLMQVPFRLPGKTIYRLDFLEFWANGEVVPSEVKGFMTPMGKLKIQQCEDIYNISINII